MKLRAGLISVVFAALANTALAQYSTGFENPPFFSGSIAGQDAWSTAVNPATARVLTSTEIAAELTTAGLTPGQTVHSGSQALLVSGPNASNATIRVMPGFEAETKVKLDIWARPLAAGTTSAAVGNIFLTLEDGAGDRAAAFRFGTQFGSTIDYGSSLGVPWVATNTIWDSDTWYRLTLDVDYVAKTYTLAINGVLATEMPIPFYTALSDNFTQVRIFRGTNQAGMIVDDLTVIAVPEPMSAAWFVAGATLVGVPRRRR